MTQETVALGIVGVAAGAVLLVFFRSVLAGPISRLLLKRGNVKWAMRLNSHAKKPGCDGCE